MSITLSSLTSVVLGRANTLHARRQWALSLGMVVIFTVLGLSALPRDLTRSSTAITLFDPGGAISGVGAAVFVLRENGLAVRFGNAVPTPNGGIRIGFFDSLDPLLASATEPVSLPADPRLLWLLASPPERQSLREAATDLARAVPQTALAMLRSPEFTGFYRDHLVQRLRADLESAWDITRKSGAWQDLLRGYEPILRDTSSRDLRPILENHFRGVPMRMLRMNALQLLDPFHDPQWNTKPVEDAVQAALQEVRDRGLPERTIGRLLQAPPTSEFLRVFVDAMAGELAHDTALRDLISEMVSDERFRPYMNNLIARAMDLARVAPRLLISLHGSTDLNPVASFVIRTLVSGRSDRVVVFMSPEQRDAMLALDPEAVRPLAQVSG